MGETDAGLPPALLPDAPREAPGTLQEVVEVLRGASREGSSVLVWGGGTHQGLGYRVEADLVLDTGRLDRVVAWEPDDLTLVVEAGARVDEVEVMLGERRLTAGLPEVPDVATVGGVVAAGVSGYRRARYGPTRDRVLEVTLVTGDGRLVRGGGRVVKNVSGYDLPRLATGSFGALGVVGAVCLKLWPLPEARATVEVEDPQAAWLGLYRPLAVLETERGSFAYLQGTGGDVASQAARLGGPRVDHLAWPAPPGGEVGVSVRVPPSRLRQAVRRLPPEWRFVAQHGVGLLEAAGAELDPAWAEETRSWAESVGGSLVLAFGPEDLYRRLDPWGTPPPGLELQARVARSFDPCRVVNPGRLPGRV